MKKRLLAVFLSLTMCLEMAPVTAFAKEETASTVEEGSGEETDESKEAEHILQEFDVSDVVTDTDAPCNYVNHSQNEAVAWALARANEGWLVDVDGAYGCQCVDLILAYYDYLLGWHTSGNAFDYATGMNPYNHVPDGWYRAYDSPQPGDVVVWYPSVTLGWDEYLGYETGSDSSFGHIGIVTGVNGDGTFRTVETNTDWRADGNWGMDPKRKAKAFNGRYTGGVACYLRPDFPRTPDRAVEYGSFDAQLFRTSDNRYLSVGNGVSLSGTATGNADQDWHFELQSDKSYIIRNYLNGQVLDIANASQADGTTIGTFIQWGDDNGAQKWFLCQSTGGYCLVPKLNTSKCLCFDGNGNAILGPWTDTQSQIISFSMFQNKVPTTLSISGISSVDVGETMRVTADYGDADSKKGVTWTSSDPSVATIDADGFITGKKQGTVIITGTSTYNYLLTATKQITVTENHRYTVTKRVEPNCVADGSVTYTCTDCNASYTEVVAKLGHDYVPTIVPPTTTKTGYTEHVCSRCKDSYRTDETPVLKPEADGYVYADQLPAYVDREHFQIEYKNHYERIAETAPDPDWTLAEVIEDGWRNVGGQYTSLRELPTSDARVLVYYNYFHFCGPNTGNLGNYEMTDQFVHWDSINPDQVTDAYIAQWDGDLPVYVLTYNGSRLYCQTGITCDGSYGTHGARCQAWYRQYVYQDRERVLKNKYVKDSSYTDAADSAATSVSYRYKPLNTGEVEITSQPADVQAGVNATVSFSVNAENAASYQWQYSKNGGVKWVNCSAAGNKTESISLKVTASNSVNIYRCIVTGLNGEKITSETAGVELLPGVVITLNPRSNAVAVGEYATFTVETENAAGFQWQYSKDGAHWYRSNAEGNKTDTLIVKGEQKSQGNRYRCVVTGIDGNTKKSYMAAMIVMTVAPKNCTAQVGETASYTLKAEGIAEYQWQYSKDGGQTWYKSSAAGATTDTVTFTASKSNRAMIYRCKLTTPDEATAFTKPVGFE